MARSLSRGSNLEHLGCFREALLVYEEALAAPDDRRSAPDTGRLTHRIGICALEIGDSPRGFGSFLDAGRRAHGLGMRAHCGESLSAAGWGLAMHPVETPVDEAVDGDLMAAAFDGVVEEARKVLSVDGTPNLSDAMIAHARFAGLTILSSEALPDEAQSLAAEALHFDVLTPFHALHDVRGKTDVDEAAVIASMTNALARLCRDLGEQGRQRRAGVPAARDAVTEMGRQVANALRGRPCSRGSGATFVAIGGPTGRRTTTDARALALDEPDGGRERPFATRRRCRRGIRHHRRLPRSGPDGVAAGRADHPWPTSDCIGRVPECIGPGTRVGTARVSAKANLMDASTLSLGVRHRALYAYDPDIKAEVPVTGGIETSEAEEDETGDAGSLPIPPPPDPRPWPPPPRSGLRSHAADGRRLVGAACLQAQHMWRLGASLAGISTVLSVPEGILHVYLAAQVSRPDGPLHIAETLRATLAANVPPRGGAGAGGVRRLRQGKVLGRSRTAGERCGLV